MQALLAISVLHLPLLGGAALIAAPIIIHLLSKRRFRIIDWAAMDFLLDAQRRNRRRIQLENLILLLLRCLAVLLLTLLVARPVIHSTNLLGRAVTTRRIERIILLDDSPSMGARGAKKTCFEEAKDGLIGFVRGLATERPGDSFTLMLTSDPNRPIIHGQYASADKAEEWAATIGKLELSDLPAQYDQALGAVRNTLQGTAGNVNRTLYVLTDLRHRDWLAGPADKSPLTDIIKEIRPKLEHLLVADLGGRRNVNLGITGVAPLDKTPVVGVPTRFEVTVRNFGDADSSDVVVNFTAAESAPLRATVPSIRAGSSASVPFTFTFRDSGAASIIAEIGADDLPADNVFHFAADVQEGVQVLLVDGEPSSEYGQSETFFLERALSPPGELRSGNNVQVVNENQFEGLALENLQTVVLCNLYRLSEERATALEAFVKAGGGLIFFLGDQIDEAAYNARLYRNGQGLFPLKLVGIEGDESERQWLNISPKAVNHPVLRVYQGASNPFLSQVKLFKWWNTELPQESARVPAVLATLSGDKGQPLIVERAFGKGRTMVVTTTADGKWSTWPADPSFVVCALEMIAHTAKTTSGDKQMPLCSILRHMLNIGRYESQVTVTPPIKERATQLRGVAAEDGKGLLIEYDDTRQRGFYRISATRRDGKPEQFLYAANIDPEEGDLRRADPTELRRRLGDTQVEFASGLEQFRSKQQTSQGELWRAVLLALALALGFEQFLGWWFGRRR